MATETLRPNAAGDETSIANQYPASGEHWDKVDEETPDEYSTQVYTSNTSYQRDLYNLPASAGSGTINFIKIYFRCFGHINGNCYAKPSLKSNSTVTDGTEVNPSTSWVTYSEQWNTNPADSQAWEWADIDALQIGVSLRGNGGLEIARYTQVYVEVDYTGAGVTEKTSSDASSGADAKASGNPVATLVKAETGSGSDILSQAQAILDGVETGSGVDAVDSLETPEAKSSSDAGSGVEATPISSATLAGTETGSGIEALITRLLAAFDNGTSAEASEIGGGGLLKNLFATELGQGSDSLTAKIEIPTKGGGMKLWT